VPENSPIGRRILGIGRDPCGGKPDRRQEDLCHFSFLICLPVADEAGPTSARGIIKRNAIELLGGFDAPSPDSASPAWLGHFSGREKVRLSGPWNNNHVDEPYEPGFLDLSAKLTAEARD
jgi:hypothetical protein